MNYTKILFSTCIVALMFNLSFAQSIDLLKYPDFFPESKDTNLLNLDNKIYTNGKSFTYDYKVVIRNDTNSYIYNLKPYWKIIQNDTTLDYKVSLINKNLAQGSLLEGISIEKVSIDVCYSSCRQQLAKEQTIIKYKYLNSKGVINIISELTGVIDDSIRLFLHPPRMVSFGLLEFSPFPRIEYPLLIGKQWKSNLNIPKGFAKKCGYESDTNISLKSEYKITGKILYKNYDCYVIEAVGKDEHAKINTSSIFYFNEKLGFVRMSFNLLDNNQLIFDLN